MNARQTRLDVGERSIVVAVHPRDVGADFSPSRQEKIQIAVVVVVAPGHGATL